VQDSIARVANRVHVNSFAEEMMVIIEADISKIETMEDRRYAAMLDKDMNMLRSILHDQLTYVHSSGVTDTKASYIAGLETGVWDYRCIRRSKQTIRVQGSLALVFNRISMNIAVRGHLVCMENRDLAVWIYEANIWRLIAVQSSAILPSAEVASVWGSDDKDQKEIPVWSSSVPTIFKASISIRFLDS
jgi:hypothetical protein